MTDTLGVTSSNLPQPPIKPRDSDCCGGGCSMCVFDLYEIQLSAWKRRCQQLQVNGSFESLCIEEEVNSPISLDEFKQFKIQSVEVLNHDTKLFEIELPMKSIPVSAVNNRIWHVVLRQFSPHSNVPLSRSFTPLPSEILECKRDDQKVCNLQLVVKYYADGRFSKLMNSTNPGSQVEIMGPFQSNFKYSKNKYDHLLLLSAGTGLLPMLQLITSVLCSSTTDPDDTRIRLLLANKTHADILFRSELLDLSRNWNFSVKHFLSRVSSTLPVAAAGTSDVNWGEDVVLTRITLSTLNEETAKFRGQTSGMVLVCGTSVFEETMLTFCSDLGLADCVSRL